MKDVMRQKRGDEKNRREFRLTKTQKKIDVDRCRLQWDRKGEIEKDSREFRLMKRQKKIKVD